MSISYLEAIIAFRALSLIRRSSLIGVVISFARHGRRLMRNNETHIRIITFNLYFNIGAALLIIPRVA